MMEIDEAIGQVENLYRAVTGNDLPQPPEAPYAPIPAEQDPAAHVKEQMDRLLAALAEPMSQAAMQARPWSPLVTVCDTGAELQVYIDVPGVSRERLDVRVEGQRLIVAGQRPWLDANGNGNAMGNAHAARNGSRPRVFAEQPFGNFRREVPLPPTLKTSDMSAQLKDGVLTVRIPRSSDASSRTVTVS
jgi:HSP20 family protein